MGCIIPLGKPLLLSKYELTEVKNILTGQEEIINTFISVLKSLCLKASQSTKVNFEKGANMPWEFSSAFHSATNLTRCHKLEK